MVRCDLILSDMLSILKLGGDGFLREEFGADAVHILQNRVLSCPKYVSEIQVGSSSSENQWKQLVKMAFQLFEVIPKGNIIKERQFRPFLIK